MGLSTTSAHPTALKPGHPYRRRTGVLRASGCLLACAVLLVRCGPDPEPPPGVETAARILTATIRLNQEEIPPDSLAARRKELFRSHGTDEQEIRAWIAEMRDDPEAGRDLARRIARNLETPSPTSRRLDAVSETGATDGPE